MVGTRTAPSWALAAGIGGVLVVVLGVAIVAYRATAGGEPVPPGAAPPSAASPAAAAPTTATPAGAAAAGDQTDAFRAFALVGEPFPPEWLVRTQRVYFAESGQLWAEATMPRNPPERVRTIESICAELTDFVTTSLRVAWPGVSVREVGGAELHTKAAQDGSCTP